MGIYVRTLGVQQAYGRIPQSALLGRRESLAKHLI